MNRNTLKKLRKLQKQQDKQTKKIDKWLEEVALTFDILNNKIEISKQYDILLKVSKEND